MTLSYKSKEKAEREGLQDMGATLTLEIDSEVKVRIDTINIDSAKTSVPRLCNEATLVPYLGHWIICPLPEVRPSN